MSADEETEIDCTDQSIYYQERFCERPPDHSEDVVEVLTATSGADRIAPTVAPIATVGALTTLPTTGPDLTDAGLVASLLLAAGTVAMLVARPRQRKP